MLGCRPSSQLQNVSVGGGVMALKVFRERSRTALHFSGSVVPCLIGEKLFRHSLGISPPRA